MARPILIAGAGIAGACAAFELARHHDGPVHVFEADQPAAGASGAAAGLVNPLMGRRARPVWRLPQALDAVDRILQDAGCEHLLEGNGVLRPTVEPEQVDSFQNAAAAHPDLAEWLSEDAVREKAPDIRTCGGGLFIRRGGAVDVAALVRAILDAGKKHGVKLHTSSRALYWSEQQDHVLLEVEQADSDEHVIKEYEGAYLLLCLGQGYVNVPELTNLALTGIKGQTVHVRRPPESGDGPLLPLSGRGYIVPNDDGTLILGSSYTHNFDSLDPDPDETAYILKKTSHMLPGLQEAEILGVTTGVRVKHANSNLPIVGPLPGRRRIWTFTALGSKGLLTAPMLAHELPGYLQNPSIIPLDVEMPDLLT
ncbi:glycine oxidase [Longibacter salinarum]|uniref:Glycine oxidase n=1 Tax=Longibacter salinarum TaxID=1850348 RepID=A0A2A8D1F2_9BACT|nr:FAD-dependent oxidoreductase [Longibacter salinarum]PEN14792.1 glycine oxidase [Longibacter salinarum]